MTTAKKASSSQTVFYRDPSYVPPDGEPKAQEVEVVAGDPDADGILTVKVPFLDDVTAQVARLGQQQFGSAFWVATEDELPY